MELREHHCLGNEEYLMSGMGSDEFSGDPVNAWIPRGTTFNENNVSLLCTLLNVCFCLQTTSRLAREKWRDDGALRNRTLTSGLLFRFILFE